MNISRKAEDCTYLYLFPFSHTLYKRERERWSSVKDSRL